MHRFLTIILGVILFSNVVWAAPAPEEFGKRKAIYDAAISPNGERIALFVNIDGEYGLHVINLGGNNTDKGAVLLERGTKPGWIKWANNDRVLASVWTNEIYLGTPYTTGHIYTLDADSMEGEFLVKPQADRVKLGSRMAKAQGIFRQYNNIVIDHLEDDPDHILMAFSDETVLQPDVQLVDVTSGDYKQIHRGREGVERWTTDRRGDVRIAQGRIEKGSRVEWRLEIRNAGLDEWKSSDDYPGLDANETIYGFTGNPNELIIGDRAGKDTVGLYIYDLGLKKVSRRLFHHDEYDAGGLVFSGDGHEVIGATFTSETVETQLFDGYDSTLDTLRKQYPEYTIDFTDQSRDGKRILVNLSNASNAGGVYLIDSATLQVQKLLDHYEGLPPAEMGEVIPVKYTARDGNSIPAYVTIPPSITETSQLKNLPFIILPHGGPYARDSQRFDYFAQFFATRGYGVLQMNFRGSSGYGQTFEDAGRDNWVVMQEDVTDGAKWLIEKGYADADRVCIAGWSYGGYAALMGAINHPDLYRCAVSMAGVTDLKDMTIDMKDYSYGRAAAKDFVLRGFEDKDDLKINSPRRRADEIKIPVFLAHGEEDQRVHFDQFKRMKRELEKAGADATFVEFEDEDHFLSEQENRIKFFKELDKFLEEKMGPSEHKI